MYYLYYVVSTMIFILDIVFSLNTAVYDQGFIIFDRKTIILKYIKEKFIFDVINILGIFSNHYTFVYIPILLLIRAYLLMHLIE